MGASTSIGVNHLASLPVGVVSDSGIESFYWPKQAELINNSQHDYIVVGGGTAGCVLATRLAEDRNNSVLLLEAGSHPPIVALLAAFFSIFPGSQWDYDFFSTEDKYGARGQYNHTKLTAGKMLGGSATINHFIYSRPGPSDNNEWDNLIRQGIKNPAVSWDYESVLPYYKKSERLDDDEIKSQHEEFYGTSGPMGLTRQVHNNEVADLLKSFAEVGNPSVLDFNNINTVGYTQPLYIIADGKRQTPAYSYFNTVGNNSNLYISMNTKVIKIVFKNNVAVAVEAVYKGQLYTLRANKEIIICAGVFKSPQLLMLSGIGHKQHLESLKIDTLIDLPVGDNLMDQFAVNMLFKLEDHLLPIPNPVDLPLIPTKIPFPVMLGAVALNKSDIRPDYQNFVLNLKHNIPILTTACATVFRLRNDICDRWNNQVGSSDSIYNLLAHLHPKSRGTVRLNSTDPFDDPVITTGYYTETEDLQHMLNVVKDFIQVGKTKYFKKVKARLLGLDIPDCEHEEKGSDAFWICFILSHTTTSYHSVGTCPMGKVVDEKMKVIGVEKLRVVDASVIPIIPRTAPYSTIMMVAERGADIIKNDNTL